MKHGPMEKKRVLLPPRIRKKPVKGKWYHCQIIDKDLVDLKYSYTWAT
jgi:hypothetical protein